LLKPIKIFLSSSGELKDEREKIALFIAKKNNTLVKQDVFIELVVWEELLHSFIGERIQDYFNEEMLKCDIIIVLFYKKLGQFTKEEFYLAYKNLKYGSNPKYMFVFFKEANIPMSEINEDFMAVMKLKRDIENFGQIYNTFENVDNLINKIQRQLDYILKIPNIENRRSKLKTRRVDAAVPEYAKINEKIDLIVQVRFIDSPLLETSDFPTKQKLFSIERISDQVNIDFPVNKENELSSTYLYIKIIESEYFKIEGSSEKKIEVPPDINSKKIIFYLIPLKEGSCRINVEIYTIEKEIYLGAIPIETIVRNSTSEQSKYILGQLFLKVKVADEYFIDKSISKSLSTQKMLQPIIKSSRKYMEKESIYTTMSQERMPAVHMVYKVKTNGAIEMKELPFVIGVIGCFSGKSNSSKTINEKEFEDINPNDINKIFTAYKPKLNFKIEDMLMVFLSEVKKKRILNEDIPLIEDNVTNLQSKSKEEIKEIVNINVIPMPSMPTIEVKMEIESLDDFHPDKIVKEVPRLKRLADIREKLSYLISMPAKKFVEQKTESELTSDSSFEQTDQLTDLKEDNYIKCLFKDYIKCLFKDMLEKIESQKNADIKKNIINYIFEDLGSVKQDVIISKNAKMIIKQIICLIDQLLSTQVNAIMQHEDFKKLEASWRGLMFLVKNSNLNNLLKIKIMDATKQEVLEDISDVEIWDNSAIFKKIFTPSNIPGGQPFGAIIGDFEFTTSRPEDQTFLEQIKQVAAAANAPFIASVSPHMFEKTEKIEQIKLKSFKALESLPKLESVFDPGNNIYSDWNSLRDSEDSRYLALTIPHVLLRAPYGPETLRTKTFIYEEDLKDLKNYLWGNAAYHLGVCLTKSFTKHKWLGAIRGPNGGGLFENLPIHKFTTDEGNAGIIGPTDLLIDFTRMGELQRLGFTALVTQVNTSKAAFYFTPTVNKPKKYTGKGSEEANASAHLSAQLQYMLCVSRFAHYLKMITAYNIGTFKTRKELGIYLNDCLQKYVLNKDNADQELKAKYPLRKAEVTVTDDPYLPGYYKAIVSLMPHFQLNEEFIKIMLPLKLCFR